MPRGRKFKTIIYVRDTDGKLQETTLAELLIRQLQESEFKMDNLLPADDVNIIGIVQESESPSVQTTVNLEFEKDGNTFTGVKVYQCPIVRIVAEDEMKRIV